MKKTNAYICMDNKGEVYDVFLAKNRKELIKKVMKTYDMARGDVEDNLVFEKVNIIK